MGLYDDIPGRDPAEDEPRLYRSAAAMIEAMRRDPTGIAAEWALVAVRPLRATFADHAPLAGWEEEAWTVLRLAYRRAGLIEEPGAALGLFDARAAMADVNAAIERCEPDTLVTVSRAEAAVRFLCDHEETPDHGPVERDRLTALIARLDLRGRRGTIPG